MCVDEKVCTLKGLVLARINFREFGPILSCLKLSKAIERPKMIVDENDSFAKISPREL